MWRAGYIVSVETGCECERGGERIQGSWRGGLEVSLLTDVGACDYVWDFAGVSEGDVRSYESDNFQRGVCRVSRGRTGG